MGRGSPDDALAYWLERSGHEVVLIEKAPQFRTGGYAVDFWGVGYTVAERMGILPEVRAHGYTFREVRGSSMNAVARWEDSPRIFFAKV